MSNEMLAAIAGAVVGSAITAWLTYLLSSSTKRRDLSLYFVREFLGLQHDYASVLYLIRNPDACREGSHADENHNKLISFGDKLDVFALCYLRNDLDRGLAMDAGIRDMADSFSAEVKKSLPELQPNEGHWRHLRDLANMHHHR